MFLFVFVLLYRVRVHDHHVFLLYHGFHRMHVLLVLMAMLLEQLCLQHEMATVYLKNLFAGCFYMILYAYYGFTWIYIPQKLSLPPIIAFLIVSHYLKVIRQ